MSTPTRSSVGNFAPAPAQTLKLSPLPAEQRLCTTVLQWPASLTRVGSTTLTTCAGMIALRAETVISHDQPGLALALRQSGVQSGAQRVEAVPGHDHRTPRHGPGCRSRSMSLTYL